MEPVLVGLGSRRGRDVRFAGTVIGVLDMAMMFDVTLLVAWVGLWRSSSDSWGLVEAPGIAISDLAASLGIRRQLALYHARLFAGQGLVRLERRGLRLIGYPVRTRA